MIALLRAAAWGLGVHVAMHWAGDFGFKTEESFYYWAPIAVAIVAYLLESRKERHYENKENAVGERMRSLELSFVKMLGDVALFEGITLKTFELVDRRLEALESDEGISKDDATRMATAIDELKGTQGNIVVAYQTLSGRLDNLETDAPEVSTKRSSRGRR